MRSRPRVIRSLALAVPVLALLAGVDEAGLGGLGQEGGEPGRPAGAGESQPEGRLDPGGAGTVDLRLLGVNDFHGRLESPAARLRAPDNFPRVPIGGAAVLGAHLDKAAADLPGRTIRVHAGDMAARRRSCRATSTISRRWRR